MYICKGGRHKIEGQHYICASNAPLDLGFRTADSSNPLGLLGWRRPFRGRPGRWAYVMEGIKFAEWIHWGRVGDWIPQ
jgi:hypothetical protein